MSNYFGLNFSSHSPVGASVTLQESKFGGKRERFTIKWRGNLLL